MTTGLYADPESARGTLVNQDLLQDAYDAILAAYIPERETPVGVLAAARKAADLADAVWHEAEAEAPAYDCDKGCSWCCHQPAVVTPPEALVLAAWLARERDGHACAALGERLDGHARRAAGLDTAARFADRLPCAFLQDDGACGVYPVRPLQCRAVHSTDAGFCQRLFEEPYTVYPALQDGTLASPFLTLSKVVYTSVQMGLAAVFQERGVACSRLALEPAAAVAVRDPHGTAEHWLAGAGVFDAALWPHGD